MADRLDLVLASGLLHVERDGPGGEHLRAQENDLGFRARPFAPVEGFHCELDRQLWLGVNRVPVAAFSILSHCSGRVRVRLPVVPSVVSVTGLSDFFACPVPDGHPCPTNPGRNPGRFHREACPFPIVSGSGGHRASDGAGMEQGDPP